MSFFDDLISGGGSTDWGGIGSALAGIGLGLFGDQNDLPDDAKDILDLQRNSAEAIVNPGDKNFLALSRSLETDKISSFAEGIRNYMNLLNRGKLSGIVMPERRDEGISQAFARRRESAGEEARAQAREYLAQAAGLNSSAVPYLMQQQQNQNTATMGGIGAAGDLLSYLLTSRQPQQTANPVFAQGIAKPTVRYSSPSRY